MATSMNWIEWIKTVTLYIWLLNLRIVQYDDMQLRAFTNLNVDKNLKSITPNKFFYVSLVLVYGFY